MILSDDFGEQMGSKRPHQKILFGACAVLVGLLFPLIGFAAQLSYLKENAPEFLDTVKTNYGDMINTASLLSDYDRKMILAVIVVESEGNEGALSHRGARGLMQLMPETARSMGATDLNDPFQNILAGTKYLKELERSYGFHSSQEALVAYNMGPSRAKRWLSKYSPEDYLYVRKVMYVYALLEREERNDQRIAEAVSRKITEEAKINAARPLLTRPERISLAAFPMTLPSGRREEVRDEN